MKGNWLLYTSARVRFPEQMSQMSWARAQPDLYKMTRSGKILWLSHMQRLGNSGVRYYLYPKISWNFFCFAIICCDFNSQIISLQNIISPKTNFRLRPCWGIQWRTVLPGSGYIFFALTEHSENEVSIFIGFIGRRYNNIITGFQLVRFANFTEVDEWRRASRRSVSSEEIGIQITRYIRWSLSPEHCYYCIIIFRPINQQRFWNSKYGSHAPMNPTKAVLAERVMIFRFPIVTYFHSHRALA